MQGCQALPYLLAWGRALPCTYLFLQLHTSIQHPTGGNGSENCVFAQQNLEATETTMATMRAYLTVFSRRSQATIHQDTQRVKQGSHLGFKLSKGLHLTYLPTYLTLRRATRESRTSSRRKGILLLLLLVR